MAKTLMHHPRSSAFICGCLLLASGCEMTHETESSARKQQRAALNDPFNYNPDRDLTGAAADDVDPTDITGGGTSNLNKKALKRDWDVLMGNK